MFQYPRSIHKLGDTTVSMVRGDVDGWGQTPERGQTFAPHEVGRRCNAEDWFKA